MRNVYLIESFTLEPVEEADLVISLRPSVSYSLSRKGIKYRILEDFYNEEEMRKSEDDLFMQQVSWCRRFDDFLKENISYLGVHDLSLVYLNFSRFKLILDTLIIHCFILNKFILKYQPGKVVFVYKQKGYSDYSIYNFKTTCEQAYIDLVKTIFKQKGIELEDRKTSIELQTQHHDSDLNLSNFTRKILKQMQLKKFYNYFRYKKNLGVFKKDINAEELNLLFMDAGCEAIDCLIKSSIQKNCKVYFKADKVIKEMNNFFEREFSYKENVDTAFEILNVKEDCSKTSENLSKDNFIVNWVTEQCGIDVSDIILPYFRHFIERLIPEQAKEAEAMVNFLRDKKIDFIISRYSAGENYVSGFAAAERVKNVKKVCFQHACGMLEMKNWLYDELDYFDIYFSTDDCSQKSFAEVVKSDYISTCEVYQSPHYLKSIRIKKGRKTCNNRSVVLFIPRKLFAVRSRFNTMTYQMTWCYELRKAIINLFGKRDDYDFIYKTLPSQQWEEDSILAYVKDCGFTNVSVAFKETGKYLTMVDRVITEFPYSSLFEAVAADLPVMSLCYGTAPIMKPMKELFHKSFQRITTIDDAIQKINHFLDEESDSYKVNLTLTETDSINQLLKTKRKQKKNQLCADNGIRIS